MRIWLIDALHAGCNAGRICMLLLLSLYAFTTAAAGKNTKTVTNEELPKVLYIIPWKQAPVGDLVGKPVESLLDEALSSIDRNIFLREVSYYESLREYDRNSKSGTTKSSE